MQLSPSVYIWCLFQVFVLLKLFSNTLLQGAGRKKCHASSYPEDKKIDAQSSTEVAPGNLLMRATNLWRNDLENIIPFSLLALAAAFVAIDARIFIFLLAIFAAARVAHAVCLIRGIQPFRTVFYAVGLLCCFVLAVLIVVRFIAIMSLV